MQRFTAYELDSGHVIYLDEADAPWFEQSTWRLKRERFGFYVVNGHQQRLHRLITDAPAGLMVDHANGNTLDNRRSNLRVCTNSQNQANRRARAGANQWKAVTWHKKVGKWQAQIKVEGRSIYLGLFEDDVEAAYAYDAAARAHFGEFASLNFDADTERGAA